MSDRCVEWQLSPKTLRGAWAPFADWAGSSLVGQVIRASTRQTDRKRDQYSASKASRRTSRRSCASYPYRAARQVRSGGQSADREGARPEIPESSGDRLLSVDAPCCTCSRQKLAHRVRWPMSGGGLATVRSGGASDPLDDPPTRRSYVVR